MGRASGTHQSTIDRALEFANDFRSPACAQGLVEIEVDVFADDLYVSVSEQEVRVANVRCGNVAIVAEGAVGNIAGLKQCHVAMIVSRQMALTGSAVRPPMPVALGQTQVKFRDRLTGAVRSANL